MNLEQSFSYLKEIRLKENFNLSLSIPMNLLFIWWDYDWLFITEHSKHNTKTLLMMSKTRNKTKIYLKKVIENLSSLFFQLKSWLKWLIKLAFQHLSAKYILRAALKFPTLVWRSLSVGLWATFISVS